MGIFIWGEVGGLVGMEGALVGRAVGRNAEEEEKIDDIK